jgi:hypothetical protein
VESGDFDVQLLDENCRSVVLLELAFLTCDCLGNFSSPAEEHLVVAIAHDLVERSMRLCLVDRETVEYRGKFRSMLDDDVKQTGKKDYSVEDRDLSVECEVISEFLMERGDGKAEESSRRDSSDPFGWDSSERGELKISRERDRLCRNVERD